MFYIFKCEYMIEFNLMNLFSTIVVVSGVAAAVVEEDVGKSGFSHSSFFRFSMIFWENLIFRALRIKQFRSKCFNLNLVYTEIALMNDNNHSLTMESKILQSIFVSIFAQMSHPLSEQFNFFIFSH